LEQEVKAIMSQILEIPIGEINTATSMDSVDTWDSLRHMEIISAIEQQFQIEFEAEEAMDMTNLGVIMRILAAKKG